MELPICPGAFEIEIVYGLKGGGTMAKTFYTIKFIKYYTTDERDEIAQAKVEAWTQVLVDMGLVHDVEVEQRHE